MSTIGCLLFLGGITLGADDQKPVEKIDDPLKYLAGTWIETSVKYGGEDLIEPPGTSNHLSFDGKNFTESTNNGTKLLESEFTLVSKDKEYWEIDLPRKILIQGKNGEKNRIIVLTVAAIFRPVGKNELQIAHYDPELRNPKKRPNVFESTITNGIVLITLKRKNATQVPCNKTPTTKGITSAGPVAESSAPIRGPEKTQDTSKGDADPLHAYPRSE